MTTWWTTNRSRSRNDFEYELLDTGIFNDDRYFDVFVEYAKDGPEDILVRITAVNRGPEAAELHVLPTLWFRNDWSPWIADSNRAAEKPTLKQMNARQERARSQRASSAGQIRPFLRRRCAAAVYRERNEPRTALRGKQTKPLREGRHQRLRGPWQAGGRESRQRQGTKAAAHYKMNLGAGQTTVIRLRLSKSFSGRKGKRVWKAFR